MDKLLNFLYYNYYYAVILAQKKGTYKKIIYNGKMKSMGEEVIISHADIHSYWSNYHIR